MVYETQQQRILLWGGERGGQGPLGDTWEWDGTNWTQVADMGPFGSGAMAYDDDRSLVVYLPQHKIMFAGDVAFFYVAPFCQNANPSNWIEMCNRIEKMDVERIVPATDRPAANRNSPTCAATSCS
jgi:hypothetical protein